MARLGCCQEEPAEGPESHMLYNMWVYLAGEDSEEVLTDKLKLFSMVILRVAEPRILQDYLRQSNMNFNFEDATSLIKRFEPFYMRRLQHLAEMQMQKKADLMELQGHGLSFKPQLSQTTVQLAHSKQARMKPNHLLYSAKNSVSQVMKSFFNTKEA